jgi:predicted porin
MKKTLVVLAALAATSAFAQSSVTLSGGIAVGIIDTGAAGYKAGAWKFGNGANAININAVEDMGGGMKSGFSSQIRYSPVSGDVDSSGNGNAMFHSANGFVEGSMGNIRIGKIAEASNCAFDPWACGSGAALTEKNIGVSMLVGAAAVNNAVQYTTPTIAGFNASYLTSRAAGTTAYNNQRTTLSANYANGPLTIGYVKVDGGTNVAVANGALGAAATPTADLDTTSQSLGVAYKLGASTVRFVNARTETAGVKTANVNSINATVPLTGAYTLLAGYNKAKVGTGYTATAANDTKTAVGVNYALSKRTTLGADVFKAEAAGASTGYAFRMAHSF